MLRGCLSVADTQPFASEGAVAVAALDAVARQREPPTDNQTVTGNQTVATKVTVPAEWIQLPRLRERAVNLLFVIHQRECAEGRHASIDDAV